MRFYVPPFFSIWTLSTKLYHIFTIVQATKLHISSHYHFQWNYLLTSAYRPYSTTYHKAINVKVPEDQYFCLCSYLEPLYILSAVTFCLRSSRLKEQLLRYTLTQYNIPLWTVKFSHFTLKLFKILLRSDTKYTEVEVIILLFQIPVVKPEERSSRNGNLKKLDILSYLIRVHNTFV